MSVPFIVVRFVSPPRAGLLLQLEGVESAGGAGRAVRSGAGVAGCWAHGRAAGGGLRRSAQADASRRMAGVALRCDFFDLVSDGLSAALDSAL